MPTVVKMREKLIETVWDYYQAHGRHDLPWRTAELDGHYDPYKILVSEFMLQQTQVARVIPKFGSFTYQFPDMNALAAAPLGDVLVAWQGLGYNRRAKFLWQSAQAITQGYQGIVPDNLAALESLPGIGRNTAGAILAYAWNEPAVFIETNIRSVYIYHCFHGQDGVPDAAIEDQLKATLTLLGKGEKFAKASGASYRTFYWALMDYGTFLKQTVGNVSQASKTYARQSVFAGSVRQLRGRVLARLADSPVGSEELLTVLADPRANSVLQNLANEGLIRLVRGRYELP